jgi:hypothetical protein
LAPSFWDKNIDLPAEPPRIPRLQRAIDKASQLDGSARKKPESPRRAAALPDLVPGCGKGGGEGMVFFRRALSPSSLDVFWIHTVTVAVTVTEHGTRNRRVRGITRSRR